MIEIKLVKNLNSFKKKIGNCEPKGCHYRLCKQYVNIVGHADTFQYKYILLLTDIFIF